MTDKTATHRHGFLCAETIEHGTYQGRHADITLAGYDQRDRLDVLARRVPNHPLAAYVGKHREQLADGHARGGAA